MYVRLQLYVRAVEAMFHFHPCPSIHPSIHPSMGWTSNMGRGMCRCRMWGREYGVDVECGEGNVHPPIYPSIHPSIHVHPSIHPSIPFPISDVGEGPLVQNKRSLPDLRRPQVGNMVWTWGRERLL